MSELKQVLDEHVKQINASDAKASMSRRSGWRLTRKGWAVIALILLAWAYTGFMSPFTLLDGPTAKEECLRFAKDNQYKSTYTKPETIEVVDSWIKHGKWVVRLGYREEGKRGFTPRICVVGGYIRLVSILENSSWE
jgi:hypothetical protein